MNNFKPKKIKCVRCEKLFIRTGNNQVFCQNKCLQKDQYYKHRERKRPKELLRAKDKYRRLGKTPLWRFGYYKEHAKKSEREFSITLDEFTKLITGNCYYCGDKESQMGIDRIDNNVGYKINNSRTCCAKCNLAKGKMSEKEFIQMCKDISKRF